MSGIEIEKFSIPDSFNNIIMKKIFVFLALCSLSLQAQVNSQEELFNLLKEKDSLLFSVGFNTCDISQFEALVSDDFEFYHDKSGMQNSKTAFIENLRNGLCNPTSQYQSRRALVPGSLEVYPLFNNGVLYGAVQTGVHEFYERRKDGGEERYGSTAKFTHVWLVKDNKWQIIRVLSYNHVAGSKKE